jgi:hypothetical protein
MFGLGLEGVKVDRKRREGLVKPLKSLAYLGVRPSETVLNGFDLFKTTRHKIGTDNFPP